MEEGGKWRKSPEGPLRASVEYDSDGGKYFIAGAAAAAEESEEEEGEDEGDEEAWEEDYWEEERPLAERKAAKREKLWEKYFGDFYYTRVFGRGTEEDSSSSESEEEDADEDDDGYEEGSAGWYEDKYLAGCRIWDLWEPHEESWGFGDSPADPEERRWEKTKKLRWKRPIKGAPSFVPTAVQAEFRHLRWHGLTETDARSKFGLTQVELQEAGLQKVEYTGETCKGHSVLYSIGDLSELARNKHGTPAGLKAFLHAAARKKMEKKERRAARAASRKKALKVRAGWSASAPRPSRPAAAAPSPALPHLQQYVFFSSSKVFSSSKMKKL